MSREEARSAWVAAWLPALLAALIDGSERLRGNVSVYVLPVLLRLEPQALEPILKGALEPLRLVAGVMTSGQDGHVRLPILTHPVWQMLHDEAGQILLSAWRSLSH